MPNFQKFREEIDEVDQAIIKLLEERLEIVKKVAKYKKERNLEITDPNRWKEMIKNYKEIAGKNGLSPKMIEEIFEIIHTNSINIQSEFKEKNL